MPDHLSNAETGVEGEYAYCDTCGLLFHWEQLTLTSSGAYFCDDHVHEGMGGVTIDRKEVDESDHLHDSQQDVAAGEGPANDNNPFDYERDEERSAKEASPFWPDDPDRPDPSEYMTYPEREEDDNLS